MIVHNYELLNNSERHYMKTRLPRYNDDEILKKRAPAYCNLNTVGRYLDDSALPYYKLREINPKFYKILIKLGYLNENGELLKNDQ
jgi:hypothetical protein